MKAALCVAPFAIALTCGASMLAQASSPQGTNRPAFDVASIKSNPSTDAGINNRFGPGRFAYVNTPLVEFIQLAYGVTAEHLFGLPEWARREKFDITATHDPNLQRQQELMLQRLLEDRFALVVHRETRDLAAYELTKLRDDGRFGPGLQPSTVDCAPKPGERSACHWQYVPGRIRGTGMDWKILVNQLPSIVSRTIVDRTGLSGRFDVLLEWSTGIGATDERGSIFTALQEQLAVKLQPAIAPLDVLVIDHIERPPPD